MEKCETHTLGPGKWHKFPNTKKPQKQNKTKSLKNVENETQTVYELEYGEKL